MQCTACTRSAGQVSSNMLHARCCRTCNCCTVVLASPVERRKVRHARDFEADRAKFVNDKCLNWVATEMLALCMPHKLAITVVVAGSVRWLYVNCVTPTDICGILKAGIRSRVERK
jgi:hypothetical protein